MLKYGGICLTMLIVLSLSACGTKSACPVQEDSKRFLSLREAQEPPDLAMETPGKQIEVRMGGRTQLVDRVVSGPLCNDHWRGTVYVTCDVQVIEWQEKPLFLKDCNLSIEPGTVVYVAYHNNAAYYNGCSCHTGEQP